MWSVTRLGSLGYASAQLSPVAELCCQDLVRRLSVMETKKRMVLGELLVPLIKGTKASTFFHTYEKIVKDVLNVPGPRAWQNQNLPFLSAADCDISCFSGARWHLHQGKDCW